MKKLILAILLLPTFSHASSITLDWDSVTTNADGSPITDLAGYTLYQSTTSFNQAGIWKSTTAASTDPLISKHNVTGTTPTYTASGLVPATPYFFRLSAYNQASFQSGFNVNSIGGDVEVSTVTTSAAGMPCDTNGDGGLNVSDVQTDINAALGVCTTVCDINKDGACNVVDVQRVINAVLGSACITV